MASNVYKVQPKISGAYRGSLPRCKVNGGWYNPRQIWVKINGVWRKIYDQFWWTYWWDCTGWSGCSRGDIRNKACDGCGRRYRSCVCRRSPDSVVMSNGYCGAMPATEQACQCNCNCDCACCCD